MESTLKAEAYCAIDRKSDDLLNLSSEIWKNPELNFDEHMAHATITSFLEKEGFEVSKKTPLETAFIARYGTGSGPKIGICCEYDALPGIGHACGHNLIAEAAVAAGLGVQAVLKSHPDLKGEVIVYGTPAEEGGGGKCIMIEKGSFDECDVCMMVHPCPYDIVAGSYLSITQMTITFHGKASHAAAAPWEGINALDAAVACYTSVSMLRQQMKPTARVHGIISDGGEKPNIIPRKAVLNYYVRDLTDEGVAVLAEKVVNCAKAAAVATGCTVTFGREEMEYKSVLTNSHLAKLYTANAKELGIDFDAPLPGNLPAGSTDMGNVSKIKPSIHPLYKIPTTGMNHTEAFTDATGSKESQLPTLIAAKAMAATSIDLLCNPTDLQTAKDVFAGSVAKS